jgi:GAF domain-containing protein
MRNPKVTAILSLITDGQGRQATLPVRLCAECLSALPISGVSMTMAAVGESDGIVLAATDRRARNLETSQSELQEGPGIDAALGGRPVLQPDLSMAGPTRWPKFCKVMRPTGVRAVFAFPLADDAGHLGVLTLYRDAPGRLNNVELAEVLAFADAATTVLRHLWKRRGLDGERFTAAHVQQAVTMIAAQLGTTPADALPRLRAHAYATGRTVTAVAADVVSRRLRFGAAGS